MTREDLRALREKHQLTQKAMGALLGYTANYISRLERGDEEISERFEKYTVALLKKKKRKISSEHLTIHNG